MNDLESDWTKELQELNIWDDVYTLYEADDIEDKIVANIILCYTVLAYDNNSKMLEPHKDRWENKKKIIVKLAGLSALATKIYPRVLDNKHEEAFALANWYVDYQKDWRWGTIITYMDYDRMANNMSNKGAIDAQEGVQIGKMLELSTKRRREADLLLDEIRTEFLSLDTALSKEDREKITDVEINNFMDYAQYLHNKKAKENPVA
jgi:hypothetical protein